MSTRGSPGSSGPDYIPPSAQWGPSCGPGRDGCARKDVRVRETDLWVALPHGCRAHGRSVPVAFSIDLAVAEAGPGEAMSDDCVNVGRNGHTPRSRGCPRWGSNPHWADFRDAASRPLWPLPATMSTLDPPPAPPTDRGRRHFMPRTMPRPLPYNRHRVPHSEMTRTSLASSTASTPPRVLQPSRSRGGVLARRRPPRHAGQAVGYGCDGVRAADRAESGFNTASVVDPFGNVLGIMHNPHYVELLGARQRG